jgi:cation diffusion facilitator family transporter
MSDPSDSYNQVHAVAEQPYGEGEGKQAHLHADEGNGEQHHTGHSHAAITPLTDPSLTTRAGILAVQASLAVLLVTAFLQAGVALRSGSVALLADTIHNFADALTAIPLWLAFSLSRRLRNQRYTYGYGRSEDLAGTAIVVLIFLSALEVFYQSVHKILYPVQVSALGWVAAAAGVGFLGNELAALLRLRTGRRIHSAALVADGRHSLVDGFTSLGVLVGVAGIKLGLSMADPLMGFVIGVTILVVAWSSGRDLWYRLMDATDPETTILVKRTATQVTGVLDVQTIRIRWIGHWQHCELHMTVEGSILTSESHHIAESVRHALFHALPSLQDITVHVDPLENPPGSEHEMTAHHSP